MNNHGIFSPDRTKVRTLLSIKSIFLFLLFTFAFEMAYASSVYYAICRENRITGF